MYKLQFSQLTSKVVSVFRLEDNAFIPFDPANTDYATFRRQVLAGDATLQDANGVAMTPVAATAYVETLP